MGADDLEVGLKGRNLGAWIDNTFKPSNQYIERVTNGDQILGMISVTLFFTSKPSEQTHKASRSSYFSIYIQHESVTKRSTIDFRKRFSNLVVDISNIIYL